MSLNTQHIITVACLSNILKYPALPEIVYKLLCLKQKLGYSPLKLQQRFIIGYVTS